MSRAEVQEGLIEAMNGDLSDAVKSFTFSDNTSGTYDPVTDTKTAGTSYDGRGIFYADGHDEDDGEVLRKDMRTLIIVNSEFSVKPQVDWFVTVEGSDYQAFKVEVDPFDATTTLYLQKR